jgi:hypothetical protein
MVSTFLTMGWVCVGSVSVAKERLGLRRESLSLPGAPSVVLSTDINEDGIRDLVVAVAYTEWDQIDFEETSEMQGIEGLVMVMTVIPSLMDRRELWVFLGEPDGGYGEPIPPMPLDLSVLSLDYGPEWSSVLALTDDGVSRLVFEEHGSTLRLEPMLSSSPVMAHSATLIPNLGLSQDLNEDRVLDLLVPVDQGFEVFLATDRKRFERADSVVLLPGATTRPRNTVTRFYPMPVIRDINGDLRPDFLVPDRRLDWDDFTLLENLGEGRFSKPIRPIETDEIVSDETTHDSEVVETVVHYGDIDGDGIAEYLTEESLEDRDAGWRKEIKEAKRPPRRYRVYRSEADFGRARDAITEFDATGYAFDLEDADIHLPGGFKDLNGDLRQDLVTMTLDFSLLQAFRVLTTQRISVGLDFFVWCQEENGSFRPVEDLDLSGKFRINLKNLQLGQLSQFAGDFDGDGRIDFLQVGRGKNVSIHRGQSDCSYPSEPDLTIRLGEAPQDLSLVQVRDLNGDDLADLMITQPRDPSEAGVTAPVRLDLYLSGGSR